MRTLSEAAAVARGPGPGAPAPAPVIPAVSCVGPAQRSDTSGVVAGDAAAVSGSGAQGSGTAASRGGSVGGASDGVGIRAVSFGSGWVTVLLLAAAVAGTPS